MNTKLGQNALGQYRSTNAYGAAAADDRLQLILHMMDGAISRIATARGHMARNEAALKGEEIGRAIGLIDGLRTSLDKDQGGDIAQNLEALYDYMMHRLVEANLNDNTEILDEVEDLLHEIKSGWQGLMESPEAQQLKAVQANPSPTA